MSTSTRNILLGAIAVLALIGGVILARGLWSSQRPVPEFPSLAVSPDPSLSGTVAFLKPFPDECVYSVPATGGQPQQVVCIPGGPGELSALPGGRLQSTRYPAAESSDPAASWIIDLQTGQVTDIAPAEIPPQPSESEAAAKATGPNGEIVTCTSKDGRVELTMTTGKQSRTLLSVDAPDTYCIATPSWNADGRWFVAHDDADRLLLTTTTDPSQTRVLVDGGWGAVVVE